MTVFAMRRSALKCLVLPWLAGWAVAQAAPASPAGMQAGPRAIWVWEADSFSMLDSPEAAAAALSFAQERRIHTLYLYADAFGGRNPLVEDPALYRRLLRRLHAAGLRVEALLGSAYLRTQEYVLPEKRGAALAMVKRVLDFNAAGADPSEHFDAVHLDIEPHALPRWRTERNALMAQFLDMAAAITALRDASGQADLPIGAAIPFWLDGFRLDWRGTDTTAIAHVVGVLDYVAIMDYRNQAGGSDGIIAHARANLDAARAAGRRVVIGLETGPGELPKVTFRHLANEDLERALAATTAAFEDDAAFGGFAIHHYRTYRELVER
ncbi:MAG: hypothetical protein RL026_521 [Pseudomonadota bacterium]|jgi:hypothetical protein